MNSIPFNESGIIQVYLQKELHIFMVTIEGSDSTGNYENYHISF